MQHGLFVRIEPTRSIAGPHQIAGGDCASRTEVRVTGQQVDDVVACAVQGLCDLGHLAVEVATMPAQQPSVCDLLDQRMVEDEGRMIAILRRIEEPGANEPVQALIEVGLGAVEGAQDR